MLISVPFTLCVTVPRGLRRPGCASAEQAPEQRSHVIPSKARDLLLPAALATADPRRSAPRDDIRLLLRHVRILVIDWWRARRLDRPRAHPSNQVQLRPGLGLRARAART